ncbi:MAG: reverse transcriptase domain-containing protein [bacterium]|nr:reverse transcriptase domain-containing protein [bacterium]
MDDIYTQWHSSLVRKKQRKRTYKHFDKALDLDDKQDFAMVIKAIENISSHQFLPFLKFIKKDIRYRKDETGTPKRRIKPRPIMYASHLDAHIYSFFSFLWSQVYEKYIDRNGFTESVIAYRKITDNGVSQGKSNIHFAREVFEYIQRHGNCVAIVADITKFFDNLKHRILKEQLCAVFGVTKLGDSEYKVLRSLTAFRFILKDKSKHGAYSQLMKQIEKGGKGKSLPQTVYESGKRIIKKNKMVVGIPQGSPISGLLANIYLSTFDAAIRSTFPKDLYRRYSDDIILVCSIDSAKERLIKLKEEIKEFALDINASKVSLVKFERQLDGSVICTEVNDGNGSPVKKKYIDYLGFEFDGHSVLIRNKTLQKSYQKAHKRIRKYYNRQKSNYEHMTHRHKEKYKGGSYMSNAEAAMQALGSKIDSQQKKFKKFIRKNKRSAGDSVIK